LIKRACANDTPAPPAARLAAAALRQRGPERLPSDLARRRRRPGQRRGKLLLVDRVPSGTPQQRIDPAGAPEDFARADERWHTEDSCGHRGAGLVGQTLFDYGIVGGVGKRRRVESVFLRDTQQLTWRGNIEPPPPCRVHQGETETPPCAPI